MLKRSISPTVTVIQQIPSTPVLLGRNTLDEVLFNSPGECILQLKYVAGTQIPACRAVCS